MKPFYRFHIFVRIGRQIFMATNDAYPDLGLILVGIDY